MVIQMETGEQDDVLVLRYLNGLNELDSPSTQLHYPFLIISVCCMKVTVNGTVLFSSKMEACLL